MGNEMNCCSENDVSKQYTKASKPIIIEKEGFSFNNLPSQYAFDAPPKLVKEKAEGEVTDYKISENIVYTGRLYNKLPNGLGKVIILDKDKNETERYEGNFANGQRHGRGKQTIKNDFTYEGQWRNNRKNGIGKLLLKNGDTYEGQFLNDAFNGNGKFVFKNQGVYEGQWKDNMMHGNGNFRYEDGREYIGEYKNDMKEGKGEFRWPDGRIYRGNFFKNKQHGAGEMIGTDMILISGVWNNGELTKGN